MAQAMQLRERSEDAMERKLWLRGFGCVLVVGAAYGCAAGEDNTDVVVSNDTTLPSCGSRAPANATTLPPDPTNGNPTGDTTTGQSQVDDPATSDDPCAGGAGNDSNGSSNPGDGGSPSR